MSQGQKEFLYNQIEEILKSQNEVNAGQIETLTELVTKSQLQLNKLGEILLAQEQSIPKFCVSSDTIKQSSVAGGVSILKVEYRPYMSGTAKLKGRFTNTSTQSTTILVKQNGVNIMSGTVAGTNEDIHYVDMNLNISFVEGDVFEIVKGNFLQHSKIDVCYIEVVKPSGIFK